MSDAQTHTLLAPSGNLLVLPGYLNSDFSQHARWTRGALEFKVPHEALGDADGRISAADGTVTELERRSSFSPRIARVLYPQVTHPSEGSRPFRLSRWNTEIAQPQPISDETPLRVTAVEILALEGCEAITGSVEKSLGVALIHLDSLDGHDISSLTDVAHNLSRDINYGPGRRALVTRLNALLADPFDFDVSLPGEEENVPRVYPVLTINSIDILSPDHDHQSLLTFREMATMTPSHTHGTRSAAARQERLQRTRNELIRISDQWTRMTTRHATVFGRTGESTFGMAQTYVSSIYGDGVALSVLSRTCHVLVEQQLSTAVEQIMDDVGRPAAVRLGEALNLQIAHMWVCNILDRANVASSRVLRELTSALDEAFSIRAISQKNDDDIAALIGVAQVRHEKETAEHEAEQAKRSEQTNFMLTLIALAGLPLTILYAYLDIAHPGDQVQSLGFVGGTAVIAVFTAVVLLVTRRRGGS